MSSNEHPNLHACDFSGPKSLASSPYVQPNTPYVQSDSIGCNSNLEKKTH